MKTFLKVISVIIFILAIVGIVSGILAAVGGGIVGNMQMNGYTQNEMALAGGVVALASVLIILGSVFNLLIGIFGWQGAKGNLQRLKTAIVLGWISAVLSGIGFLITIGGSGFSLSELTNLLLPVLFLVAAYGARKELGAE